MSGKNNKGYVHVYTGNGKGKTTAAFGLALRAAGAGMKVYIAQFAKCSDCSELAAFRRFEGVVMVEQLGTGRFIHGTPSQEDVNAAVAGLQRVRKVVMSGNYQVVVLDEVNIALSMGLIQVADVLGIIASRPPHIEMILTGRQALPEIIEAADLVTEMREVKHYYSRGVTARVGIEK